MFSNIFKSSLSRCIDKFDKTNNIQIRNKYKNICKILDGIQITDDIQIINKKFTELLHLWFNDNAILHEICKHLTSIGICVLHEIIIWKNIGNTGQTMYVIPHNYGYDDMPESGKQHNTSYLDEELYYNTQIKECPNNIMAIPISIYNNNDEMSHANMLIVKKQENNPVKILVEWFEPFGNRTTENNEFEITQLIHNLFVYDLRITRQDEINIMSVSQNCSLQMHVVFSKYSKSCAIFSLWYAIERLLHPEKDPIETYKNMEMYLTKLNPTLAIKNIILSFMMLININNDGVINDKKKIDKSILSKIIGGRNKTKKILTHKSEDYKLSVVEYYLTEDKTPEEVCKIFKCSVRSLLRWVDKYNENGEIKRHNRKPVAYRREKYIKKPSNRTRKLKITCFEKSAFQMSKGV